MLAWWFRMTGRSQRLHFGPLHRVVPVSRVFGYDRGIPIGRHYVESFLSANALDIRGRVLEIGDATYTRKFGGERVVRSDVLHAVEGNKEATLVGDLATGRGIPTDTFDCIVATQTYIFIYDIKSAIANTHRALKPGGVLLATFSGTCQVSRHDMDRWGDYWRLTDLAVKRLFSEVFDPEMLVVETHGNVLVACAVFQGLAVHELTRAELDYKDPDYQVIITLRAVKS